MARSVTLAAGSTAGAPPVSSAPVGPQGSRTRRPAARFSLGAPAPDVRALWTLLALETLASVALRRWSRHHHGG